MKQIKKHDHKAVEWLYQQIPELIEQGIIPAESGKMLRDYYGPVVRDTGSRAFAVFSIIGVILVGLGIMMLFAHNWDNLTRSSRSVIALGILLFAQMMAGMTLWFRWRHPAWSEGVSTFLMLMVGTSITLIGQTYHIADDTSTFLLVWMLLSIPLVYIMNAFIVAVLCITGITVWSFTVFAGSGGIHFVWLLYALILPYYRRLLENGKYSNSAVAFSWVLISGITLAFGRGFEYYMGGLWPLVYNLLFTNLYYIGINWFDDAVSLRRRPYKLIGIVGVVATVYLSTFSSVMHNIPVNLVILSVIAGLFIIFTCFCLYSLRIKNKEMAVYAASPLVLGTGFLLHYTVPTWPWLMIIANGALLVIGVMSILEGIRQGKVGNLNFGMLVIMLQIMTRFMDTDVSFIVRGTVFVIIGILFLLANVIIVSRKRKDEHKYE